MEPLTKEQQKAVADARTTAMLITFGLGVMLGWVFGFASGTKSKVISTSTSTSN